MEDEMLPEYDLKSLRVRKLGAARKSFGGTTLRLESDVAEMFPKADAVNKETQHNNAGCDPAYPPDLRYRADRVIIPLTD